jgi:multiple antibiotic resistance protein
MQFILPTTFIQQEPQMPKAELLNYFVALFVICSPISAFPALLSMTHDRSTDERKRIGLVAGFAAGMILILVTWIGSPLLSFFGIGVPAFQFAGGIVVFLLALSMLKAEPSPIKETSEEQKGMRRKESIAVVPLAIPIMAGPGAISTVIVAVNNHPGWLNQLYFTICAVLVAGALGFILYFAGTLEKILGRTGINIINRIGGLILAALAAETLAKGIVGLFPVLGRT